MIERNFSRAALHYEEHARVQAEVARDLLSLSAEIEPSAILELGCGTGIYTRELRKAFTDARIKAIDISEPMIEVAGRTLGDPLTEFRCLDAEEFREGTYDLITSSAAFHWFADLDRALSKAKAMLNDRGVLTFSYFGPETYRELGSIIESVTGAPVRLGCADFLAPDNIRDVLSHLFASSSVDERLYSEEYASVRELLRNIKLTGTRGKNSASALSWTQGLLRESDIAYRSRFGCIKASYQVYLCRAMK